MPGFHGQYIGRSVFKQTLGTTVLPSSAWTWFQSTSVELRRKMTCLAHLRAGSAVTGPAGPSICCSKSFSRTSARPRKHAGVLASRDTANTSQATDLNELNIFDDAVVPSISIESLSPGGFRLRNGKQILGGSGLLLVGGEAFAWRPWGRLKTLANAKGQWEVDDDAFGLLGLVWPRPDLLILGVGPEIQPLSPKTKRNIMALGMRVEILDTRNAASQFNMLATERGVDDVAAALIPAGWRDDIGAA